MKTRSRTWPVIVLLLLVAVWAAANRGGEVRLQSLELRSGSHRLFLGKGTDEGEVGLDVTGGRGRRLRAAVFRRARNVDAKEIAYAAMEVLGSGGRTPDAERPAVVLGVTPPAGEGSIAALMTQEKGSDVVGPGIVIHQGNPLLSAWAHRKVITWEGETGRLWLMLTGQRAIRLECSGVRPWMPGQDD